MSKNPSKSPLKNSKKLRYAGQSLDDKIAKVNSKIDEYFYTSTYLFGAVVLGWIMYLIPTASSFLSIITITVLLVLHTGFMIYKIIDLKKNRTNLRLGRDGEKEVSTILDSLRKEGMHIFHDVINEDKTFNLDHILISTKGIFIIETKTYSKRHANAKIKCSANGFVIQNGQEYSGRNILKQVKLQADWLKNKIGNDNIFSIITFPGWWVDGFLSHEKNIEIRNEKNIKQLIDSKPDILTIEQSNMISNVLYSHVRMSFYD